MKVIAIFGVAKKAFLIFGFSIVLAKGKFVFFYLILLFSLIFRSGFSQSIQFTRSGDRTFLIENLIGQKKDLPRDSVRLVTYLQPLTQYLSTTEDREVEAVYYILLASGYANILDRINNTSDHNYQKAIDIVHPASALKAWMLVEYGFYLYDFRNISKAQNVYLNAIEIIKSLSPEKIIMPDQTYKKLGYFFGTIGDYEEAITYLEHAIRYAPQKSNLRAEILDNTGIYYLAKKDTSRAMEHFREAEMLAHEIGDFVRKGKTLGNQALVLRDRGQINEAIAFLKQDIVYSERYRADRNTMYASILLAELYVRNSNIKEAKLSLERAERYASSKVYLKKSEKEIVKLRLEIAIREGDISGELLARRRLDGLSNTLQNWDGESVLQQIRISSDRNKFNQELVRSIEQYHHEQLSKRVFIIICLILVVVIFLSTYIYKRKLSIKERNYDAMVADLQREKTAMDQKIVQASETLLTYKGYLLGKNQQIDRLTTEIDQIRISSSSFLEEKNGRLQALLDSHLMTEENWGNFKRTYQVDNPIFYDRLLTDFPEITESNLRYILLAKLDLSNKEISNLLGITSEAIKKSRQRLKKKLGLIRYQELSNLIMSKALVDS
ncbi:tetratricopeptide repeat protein [Sphingobacterium pedocola]|uniref:tetratricopeptide repeat protein n=1 Tax=Sphingobacterium pedocola TaxID=2082722 RepID=UPI0018CA5060|nr:hypothetical protein [Sphingobacterium pedocola]